MWEFFFYLFISFLLLLLLGNFGVFMSLAFKGVFSILFANLIEIFRIIYFVCRAITLILLRFLSIIFDNSIEIFELFTNIRMTIRNFL